VRAEAKLGTSGLTAVADIWAVVPVKDTDAAKQRLAPAVPAGLRRGLALAMLEDVLAALAEARGLAGRLLVTIDPAARHLASRYGAQCIGDGARDGHTGAVMAAARHLAAEGRGAMLTLPGDIPLVTAAEIERLIAAHRPAPSFTIAPSHDEMGSNAIIVSPPDAVMLRFGDDSFRPHLAAARAAGIEPAIVKLPGVALDIDNPADLAHFWQIGSRTRAGLWLAQNAGVLASAGFPLPPMPGTRPPS
jgi:2-phospho-L-lactate guanylyltransferase